MKHLFFIFLLSLFGANAYAQITILRSDYTVSGVIVDTSKSKSIGIVGLAIPQRGLNRTWDYTYTVDTTGSGGPVNTPATAAQLTDINFKDATFVSRPQPAFGTYAIVDTQ